MEDRKKFNDCIKQRLKLSKQTKLPKLKEVLLKLNPKYDMKGKKRKDIVAEILKIKKCDKLIDVTLDDDEFEEEYVIDNVTYETRQKEVGGMIQEPEPEEPEFTIEFDDSDEEFVIEEVEYITPTPAPKNIEPVVNNIQNKLEELKAVGEAKGAVSYSSATVIRDLAFVNLIEKYGAKCIISDINKIRGNPVLDVSLIVQNREDWFFSNNVIKNLGKKIKDCVDRGVKIIAIPLSLKFGLEFGKGLGHANMLIYRPFKRLVERFEPHGKYYRSFRDDDIFNEHLKELFEVRLSRVLGRIRYRKPRNICPSRKGFQSLENQIQGMSIEGGGFCSMWSLFFMEMIFLNPDLSTTEIMEDVFKITKKDPAYLKSVIRGYVVEIEDTLDKLLKKMKAPGFSFERDLEQIYDYESALVKWVTGVIFDTGKYSEAPPGFEPLIDVVDDDDKEKLLETYRDKISHLTIEQLKNIYKLYGRRVDASKPKNEIIYGLVVGLAEGDLAEYGATGLKDLDVILKNELYELGSKLPKNYFSIVNKKRKLIIDGPEGDKSDLSFKELRDKLAEEEEEGGSAMRGFTKAMSKINPMSIALSHKKSRNFMTQMGDDTRDYYLPELVSIGIPVAQNVAAMGSTILTGNPVLGRALFDATYKNMVTDKGYDPRDQSKSKKINKASKQASAAISGKVF